MSASPEVLASNKADANTDTNTAIDSDTTVAATNIPAESPAQTPTAGGAMSGEDMFDIQVSGDRTSYAADDPSATALAAEP